MLLTVFKVNSFTITNNINDDIKTKFKIEIKNSIGEPQTKVFLKISGRSEVYKADTCGIINFEYEVPKNYQKTANIYLYEDTKNPEKEFILDNEKTELSFCIDSKEDILKFKQENSIFNIEGIVTTEDGEPITGATVSIQGTGKYTTTDEIGLFAIEADFNHYIIIRADGMENLSMTVTPFLMNQKDAYGIVMHKKNGDKIYSSVETMPQYPGGMKYFKRYIDRNLKYPEEAKKNKIEGVVVMQFVVEKNGDITNPRVVRRLESSLDSVAMNLIKGMPRWTPASDHGMKVRCKYSVPISFKIPVPKPVVVDSIPLKHTTLGGDSILINDSIITLTDTLSSDTIINDSILTDSIITTKNDSIAQDTTIVKELLDKKQISEGNKTKVKKRNIFIRFFRWLFGIKDKDEKESDEQQNIEDNGKEKESSANTKTEEETIIKENKK